MRKVSFFIAIIFLMLSLISFGYEGEKRVLRQGKKLKSWILDETLDEVYRYLDGAGIDIDKLARNPYFYERDAEGIFFLEIEGDFKNLNVRSKGFIEDRFHIKGNAYSVKFRPNYNEVALVYDDERVYISNSLEKVYMGIENTENLKGELTSYFDKNSAFIDREIRYKDQKTIYGNSFLKAVESKEGTRKEKLFFKSFSIDEDIKSSQEIGESRVILDYPELAKKMMNSIPEINLDAARIEKLLEERVDGVFALEEGIALKSKEPMDESVVVELYNEGVLKRIGLETGREGEFFFLEFPFFEKKKYIFEDENWIFISENLEYMEHLKTVSEVDRSEFLDRLKTLLEFKEESIGYTRYKEGV